MPSRPRERAWSGHDSQEFKEYFLGFGVRHLRKASNDIEIVGAQRIGKAFQFAVFSVHARWFLWDFGLVALRDGDFAFSVKPICP
jgi:hypothetical protein